MKKTFAVALLMAAASLGATCGWSQQRPAITGLAFVRVYASDAAASAKFYGTTLGYSPRKEGDVTRYDVNGLQWIEVKPLPSPTPPTRLEAIGFTTRNAKQLEGYLKAHSVAIVDPLKNGKFSVRDPEGNLIFFVQQTKPSSAKAPAGAVSRHMIHAGLVVKDRAKEDTFYRDILGFRPYWYGGPNDTTTNWVSQQVPDGSDWLEYMLNIRPDAPLKQIGVMDHMSLGVVNMNDAFATLKSNHCDGPECGPSSSKTGRDGKVQLNMYDPDLTRVELMEFAPREKPCCSEFTAKHPTEQEVY